jgi:hypothetical protein
MSHANRARAELARDIGDFAFDPLGHVLYAYPWGTEELPADGPRRWQAGVLNDIGEHLANPETRFTPLRIAVASGHGIGKSAEISMILKWALDTCPDTRIVITANTEGQLVGKTMAEVAKWTGLSITREWFKASAMAVASTLPGHDRSWRADAVTWSIHNADAFAGLHNQGKRIVVIFDEASSIADRIWEVTEGALTDEHTEIIWIAFGNPTRNSGRFKECFGRHRHLWKTRQIDSRTVEGTNREYLDEIVATYGEDSDIARVRVKGEFPRAGSMQFIASDVVDDAMERETLACPSQPVIFGVDVARYGDDKSVLAARQGRDARSIPWLTWGGTDAQRDLMRVAGDIAQYAMKYRADAIFVDKGAMGAGLIDRLNQLNVPGVMPIDFGGKGGKVMVGSDLSMETANKRAHMWASMREWLDGGCVPEDPELKTDLIGVEYGYGQDQVSITLERKKDMKKRGLASPDKGDALALTFAAPVERNTARDRRPMPRRAYDPYAELME